MLYELYPNETTILLCYMPVEFTLRITHWKKKVLFPYHTSPLPPGNQCIKPTYYSKCKGIFYFY